MIELVRSELDARDQKRWRAALAETPLVARPARVIDPELPMFGLVLWIVPFVLTFEPWVADASPLMLDAIRVLIATAWFATARLTVRAWRARSCAWPSGRFLFRWGYAEVERDTLRVMPLEAVRHEISGRFLGVGPISLRLREGRWSTRLALHGDQVERVAMALEETRAFRIDSPTASYRDAAPSIQGRLARPRPNRLARELAWALLAIGVGAALSPSARAIEVHGPPVAAPSEPLESAESFRASYRSAIRPRRDEPSRLGVIVELDQCSDTPLIVSSVANYLTLALTTPNLGPAHPFLPVLGPHGPTPARLWAHCTWAVDQTAGTFLRAEARWGLDRDGSTVLERRATVEANDLIRMMAESRREGRGILLSPETLARLSLLVLERIIERDVYVTGEDGPPAERSPVSARLISDVAARVPVIDVRQR